MFTYDGVSIRPIELEDLPLMVKLRSDPSVWMNLGDIQMVSMEKQRRWFERLQEDPRRQYYILCKEKIKFIGIVRLDEIDFINRSIRIGGDILPKYQGKGYGKKMYRLLLKYCFDFLNMHRVWLLVLEKNVRALNLYKKVGFVEEGRMRKAIYRDGLYQDYIMMSILREEWEDSQ